MEPSDGKSVSIPKVLTTLKISPLPVIAQKQRQTNGGIMGSQQCHVIPACYRKVLHLEKKAR
jgi:hypothetical protein